MDDELDPHFSIEINLPMAPIYHPSSEEWEDPMSFIRKITPEASKFGIVKVIPPPNWEPPFSINPDELKFEPRLQPLNKLVAQTRLKAKWAEKYETYFKSVGKDGSFPTYNEKIVDMYLLNTLVEKTLDRVKAVDDISSDDWMQITSCLQLEAEPDTILFVRDLYNSILKPFNSFSRIALQCLTGIMEESPENAMKSAGKGRKRKRGKLSTGKKVPEKDIQTTEIELQTGLITENDVMCTFCQMKVCDQAEILGCYDCFDLYHIPCLSQRPSSSNCGSHPPSWYIWYCKSCVAKKVLQDTFGFEDCHHTFDLGTFGAFADEFKEEYFKVSNGSVIPEEAVESKFWKEVMSPNSEITVMYGADLHTLKHGSGFPVASKPIDEDDAKIYEDSGWNLTNFPKLPESVLRFIKQDISGMTVPWLYVGMLFSSFCWHNEDHWTASINYLHFGDTKTWYGVPGVEAPAFEHRMQECAPTLFKKQPDLLHQLVTLLHPNQLTDADINVYKINQKAGEFVITFPRAYHAGFNQGFNCAEAVNFASASWLQHGFESIAHYAGQRRKCVFSHEEMLCEMARETHLLSYVEAMEAHQQLCVILKEERTFRSYVQQWGVISERKVLFEDFKDDDDRTCLHCYTTVFLSALTCPCKKVTKMNLVCRNHAKQLCHCKVSKRELLFRYSIDEIEELCVGLLKRTYEFKDLKSAN